MTEINFKAILNNYRKLLNCSDIKQFLGNKGELCLATEKIPTQVIEQLYHEGHLFFAEKFGNELHDKRLNLEHLSAIRFNYFGAIQTNKLKKVLNTCEVIESISNERHANKIAELLVGLNQYPRCYVQVNTGREPQKNGVLPENAMALIQYCKDLKLPLDGLMCIPPRAKEAKEDYHFLRKLADDYRLEHCQMGFSHDYQIAINAGATAIRIGSLVFGKRA